MDDTTILCTDTAVPYTCDYQPTSNDVGKNTLSAWAVDNNGQFGADFRAVTVPKFDSPGLQARTNKKDLKGPRQVRASGELELPTGVSADEGCEGDVRIRIEDGNDTIRTRRAQVQEDCTWSKTITLPAARKIEHKRVQVFTKFLGNDVVTSEKGPPRRPGSTNPDHVSTQEKAPPRRGFLRSRGACATVRSMAVDLTLAPKQKRPPGEPCCEALVHPAVDRADAEGLAAVAKALSDPIRVQLVDVLRKHAGQVCVCELLPLFDVSQPTLSHHLKKLRDAGIVGVERHGLWAYHYVHPDSTEVLRSWLS